MARDIIIDAVERMGRTSERILEDTDLCACPSCVEYVERMEGTHTIPTDGYVDMMHPMLVVTEWGSYAIRADLRQALYLVSNAYQSVATVGDIVPE